VKASEPPGGASSGPGAAAADRWLLIGNSRWHWAWAPLDPEGALRSIHTAPGEEPPGAPLRAWAAVGPVPAGWAERLVGVPRLDLGQIPLQGAPPWLGIDRALAGWQAWQQRRRPVLVADAGTVLSLTLVDGEGRFRGGRLQAGLALQLRSMGAATAALPRFDQPLQALAAATEPWPAATAEAMVEGVSRGLAAALERAAREARALLPGCGLWLTGGDGERLAALLASGHPGAGGGWTLAPDLVLEALVALAPAQPSARSPRI
jgi:type III pantothenate kinase